MMSDNRPVGFFDSGLGGISVLKTAYCLMPFEDYIYYGDNANSPYGEKTEDEIKELSLNAGRFLYEKGVKAIVIACNTATSAAVKTMREEFRFPVISMEPAVKPALGGIKDGKALVLATPATVSQQRYLNLLDALNAFDRVISVGCGGLVELIEEGRANARTVSRYLSERLEPIKREKIGAVVLGCTHYSFIEKEITDFIKENFNPSCGVYNGREGTARQLKRVLEENGLLRGAGKKGKIEFFTSGDEKETERFRKLFYRYNPKREY